MIVEPNNTALPPAVADGAQRVVDDLFGIRTFAGRAPDILTAIKDLQAECAKAAANAKARGTQPDRPPSFRAGETIPQFEKRCLDYRGKADPAGTLGTMKDAPQPAAAKKIFMPEIRGSELWRADAEKWDHPKTTVAQLLAVTPRTAPGCSLDPEEEAKGMYASAVYLNGRELRLRFEIRRCGGPVAKAFECPAFQRHRNWQLEYTRQIGYSRELSGALNQILLQHPDKKLAARIRRENF